MSDDTGDRPTTPYQSGDLEAHARAARDEAARKLREEAAAKAAAIRAQVEQDAAEREARAQAAAPLTPAPSAPSTPVAPTLAASPAPSTPSPTSSGATAGAAAGAGALAAASTASTVNTAKDTGATASKEATATAATTAPDGVATATDEPTPPAKARNDSSMLAFFRELPVLLAVAFLLAFLLRTFVLQVFYIPSGSMIPTLEVNDRIVVEKITYLFREPERGEVVVFEGDTPPRDVNESVITKFTRGAGQFLGLVPANARDFVKRVIGLPGDEITIEDGVVTVNGVVLDEPYAVEDLRDFGPYTVPEGKLFFMGDNRPSSADSRIESGLGYVDRDHVVGRAMVIVWPFEHFDGLGTPEYPPIPSN